MLDVEGVFGGGSVADEDGFEAGVARAMLLSCVFGVRWELEVLAVVGMRSEFPALRRQGTPRREAWTG